MLALVVCGKHWYGFSSASPTSIENLSILTERKMCFKNLVTLINISETDDSGADY